MVDNPKGNNRRFAVLHKQPNVLPDFRALQRRISPNSSVRPLALKTPPKHPYIDG